jgi:hypothetical protein
MPDGKPLPLVPVILLAKSLLSALPPGPLAKDCAIKFRAMLSLLRPAVELGVNDEDSASPTIGLILKQLSRSPSFFLLRLSR